MLAVWRSGKYRRKAVSAWAKCLSKRCEAALIDPGLNIFVPYTLQVNHCRCDVPVSHPLLQRANVDSVLEVPGSVGVSKLMQKPAGAVGAFGAAIDSDGAVVELVRHLAMSAIELGAVGDGLEFFQHSAVGPACGARKERIVGAGRYRAKLLKHRNALLRHGNLAFLPILRMKSPMGLGGDAHGHVLEIDVAPGGEAPFRVTESGHQIKLEADLLVERASLEEFC